MTMRGGALYLGGRRVPLPCAAYLRGLCASPFAPAFAEDLRTRPKGLVAQCEEKAGLLAAMLMFLQRQGVLLINDLEANAQHGRKPYQLELLRRAGLPIPRYIATNDPRAVKSFVREVGRAVYKPVGGGATVRELENTDLSDERLSALALAPVLFQELIEGISVRAYVVGKQVVAAAEIHSPELDYRRDEGEIIPTRLSGAERRACVAAAKACGMSFSGVDLIRMSTDFCVLECNPSPMFAVFEKKTGLDVAGPLARLLLSAEA